ncbi:MAG: lipoyl(octanoyl) transferase LipB [Candidatus Omnitrophota bacterium]
MEIRIFDLGVTHFQESWDFQKKLLLETVNSPFPFNLVICQHYPVFTWGRSAGIKNILATEKNAREKGIRVYKVERGGDFTYHGPGQVTAYPVFNLEFLKKDLHWFLRSLEEVALKVAASFGVEAERKAGLTGVWFRNRKLASIGIAVKNWVTFHGMSINVTSDDLGNFRLIRPCGMDIEMTSLEDILRRKIDIDDVKKSLISEIKAVYKLGTAVFYAENHPCPAVY